MGLIGEAIDYNVAVAVFFVFVSSGSCILCGNEINQTIIIFIK